MQVAAEEILEASKRSFKFFMNAIIGLNNPDFLDELDDILSNEMYKKMVAAYPRGHGKSTHLSIGYPLWAIAKNHNLRIQLVSNTSTVSQGFLRGILNHIEDNERYKLFSQYCDPNGIGIKPKISKITKMEERWSSTAITVDRNDLALKDPTIQAVGLFGSIISKRADIIIGDDIVDQKNSATEEQREKIKDWFDTTLKPILIPGGRIIYLGNTWHANDLVANMLESPEWDFRSRLRAIISEPENPELWEEYAKIRLDDSIGPIERMNKAENYFITNETEMQRGVKVLWPERMPYKDLYLLRLSNSYSFARMYMCDPSLKPDQKFEESWINRAKEKGKFLKLQDEEREGLTMDFTTAGLDLAISLKDTADDTVLLSLDKVLYGNEVIKTGDFVIRNIRRGKFTPNRVREMVSGCNEQIRPLGIRVESVAYQESMVRDLWDMGHANVRGHKTGGEKNDIEIGVNSLAILLEIGKLILPYDTSDPRTIILINKLVDEMRSWPDGHTGDSLMALWFAYLEARDIKGKTFQFQGIESIGSPKKKELSIEEQNWLADQTAMKKSEGDRKSGKFVF